jgi:hypothetical protein
MDVPPATLEFQERFGAVGFPNRHYFALRAVCCR